MGAVTADVVVSTFFNFNPELVHAAIPAVWEVATPVALVAARFAAVDAAFRRLLGEDVLVVRRDAPGRRVGPPGCRGGRPAHGGAAAGRRPCRRAVARPRRTWCSGTPSRSCASTGATATSRSSWCAGLSGLEALVTHAAAGDVPERILRATRGWPEEAWDGAVDALRVRGWLEQGDELRFTAVGSPPAPRSRGRHRRAAAAPYAVLGEERCAELRALARPWSTTLAQQLP